MTITTGALGRTSRTMRFAVTEGRNQPAFAAEGGLPMEASHVSALQLKHAGLERRLEEEMSRPAA